MRFTACWVVWACSLALAMPLAGRAQEKEKPQADEKQPAEKGAEKQPEKKAAEKTDEGRVQLLKAFEVSKGADSPKEYTQMIELCEKGIEATSSAAYKEYGKKLAAWAYFKRGEAYAAASPPKEKEALADFEAAVKYLPAFPAGERPAWEVDLLHNHGVSSAMANDFDKALADFNRVIELRPSYGKEYFNRGEIYYARGDWAKAVLDYTQAIRNGYTEAVVYTRRGFTYFKQEEVGRAMADYNQAIARDRRDFEAYTYRGDAHAASGDFAAAMRDYLQAIELNDKYARVYFSAAWLRATCRDQRFRDAELALRSARKAVELAHITADPEDYRYLRTLAAAQARAGQFDEAIPTAKKALEKAKDDKVEVELLNRMLEGFEAKKAYESVAATGKKEPEKKEPEKKEPEKKEPEKKEPEKKEPEKAKQS